MTLVVARPMTLVVAIAERESIWLLADRRLSYGNRPPRDDARKVLLLETSDGVALLGYAGLGATARGTEPADWMSAVLRGQKLPLEESLNVLAATMQKELPRHLIRFPKDQTAAHYVIVPAFVGKERRLYGVNLVLTPDRKNYRFQYSRYNVPPGTTPPPMCGTGSGSLLLNNDKERLRNLRRIVRANARGSISPYMW